MIQSTSNNSQTSLEHVTKPFQTAAGQTDVLPLSAPEHAAARSGVWPSLHANRSRQSAAAAAAAALQQNVISSSHKLQQLNTTFGRPLTFFGD